MKTLPELKMVTPPAMEADAAQTTRFDVMGAVRRRPLLAGGIFLFAVCIGLPLARWRSGSKYSSTVSIYVSPSFSKNLLGEQENYAQYNTFVTQQVAALTREDILAAAIQRIDGQPYRWRKAGESVRESVDRLSQAIKVSHVPDTYLISASLTGSRREGLAELLNGLAAIAIDNAAKETFFGSDDRLSALRREKAELEAGLTGKNEELSRLSGELGMVSTDRTPANPEDKMLVNSRADLEEARKRRLEAETQFLMVSGQNASSKAALSAAADEKTAADPALNDTLTALNRKASELRMSVLGMSANHPQRKAAEQALGEIEAQLAAAQKSAHQKAEAQIIAKAQGELSRSRSVETQLEARFREQMSQVRGVSKDLQTAASLQMGSDQDRARLSAVEERIAYLQIESTAPGPLRIFAAGKEPIKPDSGSWKKTVFLILGTAFFLSAGVVVGLDLLDGTVRDAATVEQILGFAPSGLLLDERSFSREFTTEHFLRLVSGINRARQHYQARSFVLSGLTPGSESGALAEEIGKELKSQGLRVLRIEANAFQAPTRRINGCALPGWVEVLKGQVEPVEVIREGGPRAPDWIPIGNTRGRPRLPRCHRFGAILEELSAQYDVVLVEAAPLLMSSDTENMIGLASASLLVVRANTDTRKNLWLASRLLRRLEPPAVGCVLNHVELKRSGSGLQREFADYEKFRKSVRTLETVSASDPASNKEAALAPALKVAESTLASQ